MFFWALHDANYNVMGLVNPFSVARPLVERYEYTPYGQRTVYSRGWLLADVDEDGDVDQDDVIRCEGSSGVNSRCDVDGDGDVDGDDEDAIEDAIGQALNDAGDKHPTFYSSRGKDEDGLAPYLTVGLCDVGHQGLIFDKEFGLIYNRARPYDPRMGRFPVRDPMGTAVEPAVARHVSSPQLTQRDPVDQYADGMSLYEYECAAPSGYLDTTGLRSKREVAACTSVWPSRGSEYAHVWARFEDCPDSRIQTVLGVLCDAREAAGHAWVDVYRYRRGQPRIAGDPPIERRRWWHTMKGRLERWFLGDVAPRLAVEHSDVIENTLRKVFWAFKDTLQFECECACRKPSNVAYVVKGQREIHLCPMFWDETIDRRRWLLHEISHGYAGTNDMVGYVSDTNLARPSYRFTIVIGGREVVVPNLGPITTGELIWNADTYAGYIGEYYLK